MSTRIRFQKGTTVSWSALSTHSHWDATTSFTTGRLDTVGVKHSVQYALALAETTSSRQSRVWVQFQSEALKAQTIAGYLKGQIQAMVSNAAMDAAIQAHVRVVDPVTNTTRGVLWAPDKTFTTMGAAGTENYEVDTTKTNRKCPAGWSGSGVALSSVDALDGDILVIELGFRYVNTVATSYTGTLYLGGYPADDLPEDETTTATGTAWMEFSQTLQFLSTEVVEQLELSVVKVPELWPQEGAPPPRVGQIWPRGNRGV